MVRGRPALRTLLSVSAFELDELIFATIVQGDQHSFIVQCKCAALKRPDFEPVFDEVVESFEVLATAPADAGNAPGVDPPKPPLPAPRAAPDMEPAVPPADGIPTVGAAAPPKDTPLKPPPAGKPAPEPKQDDGKKAPDKDAKKGDAKGRKALDDLD